MPISRRTHHLPFVRNGFSDSAQNFGLGTTLKPFGLRRLNKSARALGPYLFLVPHGSAAENRHLGARLLLQPLQRVAFGTKQLANEVELENRKMQN